MAKYTIKSTEKILIKGKELTYILVRSKKRKYSISMKLKNDGNLQINVPFNTKHIIIEEFIIKKYQWIITHQIQNITNQVPTLLYQNGERHLYNGVEHPLQLITSKQSKVELQNNFINIYHRKKTSVKNLLNKWYKQQALELFTNRTKMFANSFNFPKIKEVKVRNMKSRWGSCSSKSVITYNINLIKATSENIDYVIIHELCHLIHPNHGNGFYQLQSKLNPNWKQQKQLLNQFGYKYIRN